MKQQSANGNPQRQEGGHDGHQEQGLKKRVPPLPTVGPPLDGSQYQNIVEEQKYSGQRPRREEQQPGPADSNRMK